MESILSALSLTVPVTVNALQKVTGLGATALTMALVGLSGQIVAIPEGILLAPPRGGRMSTYDGLWPLCETCGAVPTSHRDYRDCEAHMQVVAQAYNGGRENGVKQERAAVVAWLRGKFPEWPAGTNGFADEVERGEHRREETR